MQIKDYQVVLLGVVIALGCVFSTYILSKSIVEFQKLQNQTIRVTGSASQKVKSDLASLTINFSTKKTTLKEGYSQISEDAKIISDFFKSNNIESENIDFSSINSYENYRRLPNGYTTNEIESYTVNQRVSVKSSDIDKITDLSKKMNMLVDKNINITSNNIEYFVSNLDNIKITMVGEATKDAKQRAESMVKATGGKIGSMNSAKMGVFQIVPVDSTEVADYGINDTSSIEKKVISTVNATFTVK